MLLSSAQYLNYTYVSGFLRNSTTDIKKSIVTFAVDKLLCRSTEPQFRLSSNPKCSSESTTSSPEQPMSTTSLQSPSHLPSALESVLIIVIQCTYHQRRRGSRRPKPADVDSPNSPSLSVPTPSMLSGSDNDHTKTIISGTKLL